MATTEHLPWRYDDWEKKPWKLRAKDDHTVISIYEDCTGVGFSREQISDKDIPELCERTASQLPDRKWSFQLLMTNIPVLDAGFYSVPVPYSLVAIKALCSHWNIPYNYIPRYISFDTVTMCFSPSIGDDTWKGFTLDLEALVSTITYDSINHRTFGICVSPNTVYLERLVRRLERLPSFASNPLFAPVIMASFVAHDLRAATIQLFLDRRKTEESMAIWSEEFEKNSEKMLDMTRMPEYLNDLATQISSVEYVCSPTMIVINCLRDHLQLWPIALHPDVGVELQEQVRFLQQCMTNCLTASKRTKEGVQSMIQTVYAILQQRDNHLNHRYGADMRLITAITLIFLPGTFVATFFSTTFWDFSPDNRGAKVSYWVYLYFLVAIGLTLLVIVVWRKFSTLKRLAANVVQKGRQIPLLRILLRKKKKKNDEESGKKGR